MNNTLCLSINHQLKINEQMNERKNNRVEGGERGGGRRRGKARIDTMDAPIKAKNFF